MKMFCVFGFWIGSVNKKKTVDKIEFKEIDIIDIIKYYGSDETKTEFINHDSEPLMAVIARPLLTEHMSWNYIEKTVHTFLHCGHTVQKSCELK